MSDAEISKFRKIERYGFRITILQACTLLGLLWGWYEWSQNRGDRQLLDSSALSNDIKMLTKEVRTGHAKDSVLMRQQRVIDSLTLSTKLRLFEANIENNIDSRLNSTEKRLTKIERKMNFNYVEEVKKHGPYGPVSQKPVQNK